jgi:hypothetical protein
MKIRIDNKKLQNGVRFTHEIIDLVRPNLKVIFWYDGANFYLKNYETVNFMIFKSYQSFRKQLSLDVLDW